jgi:hypothetical protein
LPDGFQERFKGFLAFSDGLRAWFKGFLGIG